MVEEGALPNRGWKSSWMEAWWKQTKTTSSLKTVMLLTESVLELTTWPMWWVEESRHQLSLEYCVTSASLTVRKYVVSIPVWPWPRPRIPSQEPVPHRWRLPGSRFLSSRPCPSPTPLHAPTALHWGGAATDALPAGWCLRPSVAHLSGQHSRDHSPRGQHQPPCLQPSRPWPQTLGSLVPGSWPFPWSKKSSLANEFNSSNHIAFMLHNKWLSMA